MKRVLLILLVLMLVCVPAMAKEKKNVCDTALGGIFNECVQHPQQMNDHERYDYGLYLHLILMEDADKNWEVGVFNTYEHERAEFTSLVGAKIYLGRLLKKDKE